MNSLHEHNYLMVIGTHIESLEHIRRQLVFNKGYIAKEPISEQKNILQPAFIQATHRIDALLEEYYTARTYLQANNTPSVADIMEGELSAATLGVEEAFRDEA